MNTYGSFVHPEVLQKVNIKFKELYERNPEIDGSTLWAIARDYVYTMAKVDRAIMKVEMGI